jgi:hypothetical protein
MAVCSRELTERNEYPTDGSIDVMIRLQTVNVRVAETFGYFDHTMTSVRGEAAIQHTASSFLREFVLIQDLYPRSNMGSGK